MKKTIEKIVEYAARIAEPDKIILFGSMANGTNDIHSDIDLLIVLDDLNLKKQIVERVVQFEEQYSLKADVLVYSINDLEQAAKQPNSFLAGICKSGKILYQKPETPFHF